MNTFARFSGPDIRYLMHVGDRLNQVLAGFFDGIDPQHTDRFTGFVCDSEDWDEHIAAMTTFLDNAAAIIADAIAHGISIELGTSLYNEDYEHEGHHRTWCEIPPYLMRRLSEINASFTVAIYNV